MWICIVINVNAFQVKSDERQARLVERHKKRKGNRIKEPLLNSNILVVSVETDACGRLNVHHGSLMCFLRTTCKQRGWNSQLVRNFGYVRRLKPYNHSVKEEALPISFSFPAAPLTCHKGISKKSVECASDVNG